MTHPLTPVVVSALVAIVQIQQIENNGPDPMFTTPPTGDVLATITKSVDSMLSAGWQVTLSDVCGLAAGFDCAPHLNVYPGAVALGNALDMFADS